MGWGGWGGPDRLPCRAQAKLDWAGLRQYNSTYVTGHDEGSSGSSTFTPLYKGAIVCVEGLADLFFGQ